MIRALKKKKIIIILSVYIFPGKVTGLKASSLPMVQFVILSSRYTNGHVCATTNIIVVNKSQLHYINILFKYLISRYTLTNEWVVTKVR